MEKQSIQNKDDIISQENANAEKILAKLASLELKLKPRTCEFKTFRIVSKVGSNESYLLLHEIIVNPLFFSMSTSLCMFPLEQTFSVPRFSSEPARTSHTFS